jgi:hypothetical protein
MLSSFRLNIVDEKAINITYSEFVSVALGIQHTKLMRHIVICRLPRSTTFFHNISLTAGFMENY